MQIEIKGHGLAALWRDLLANSDVTSTVVAGAAALAISYAVWKIGRGFGHIGRRMAERPRLAKPVRPASKPSLAIAPPTPASGSDQQWQRLERLLSGHIQKSAAACTAHDRAALLTDALDLELADLLKDLAGVSTYAAARQRAERSAGPMLAQPAPRRPLAA